MTQPSVKTTHDVIIIGSGPAGCSAAVYATRFALKTLLLAGPMPGGLVTMGAEIENYPGFESISGPELAKKFLNHAQSLGADYQEETVTEIVRGQGDEQVFAVKTVGGGEYLGRAVIIATGTHHRKLGIPREKELTGRGVSYCTTCDARFFAGKKVAVVGGGNTAVEGAYDLSQVAERVYLIYRSQLRATPAYISNLRSQANITEVGERNVVAIRGTQEVEAIVLDREWGGQKELPVNGVFIHIGYLPANQLAKKLDCDLTEYGFVKVDSAMQTTIPGVFCAGDLNDAANFMRQIITAAAEGAVAAQSAARFLRGTDPRLTY